MNSTKILFLKFLREEIQRYTFSKNGIQSTEEMLNKTGLLTGQTISRNEIESLSSYRMMNSDEKSTVNSILTELHNKSQGTGQSMSKVYSKQIQPLVPKTVDSADYKDAA